MLQMQQFAPPLRKTTKIAKSRRKAPPFAPSSPVNKLGIALVSTPTKRTHMTHDQIATLKKPASIRPVHLLSTQVYQLDYLNCLTFADGKILNLLSPAHQRPRNERKIKCRCSKSRCELRYCECFARGKVCGSDCECINCHNLNPAKHMEKVVVQKGCKCSKSQCTKNYCECFQKGQPCTDKCSCINCKNGKN